MGDAGTGSRSDGLDTRPPPSDGGSTGDVTAPRPAPVERRGAAPLPLVLSATSPEIACTLDGGADAVRDRVAEWHAVLGRATRRSPAAGGVTLRFDPDADVAAELARLAAAESTCCSFFTFTLVVDRDGTRFTVTAPDAARDVVAGLFGTAEGGAAPA